MRATTMSAQHVHSRTASALPAPLHPINPMWSHDRYDRFYARPLRRSDEMPSSMVMVTSNHDRTDPGSPSPCHGVLDFFAGRIDHADQSEEHKSLSRSALRDATSKAYSVDHGHHGRQTLRHRDASPSVYGSCPELHPAPHGGNEGGVGMSIRAKSGWTSALHDSIVGRARSIEAAKAAPMESRFDQTQLKCKFPVKYRMHNTSRRNPVGDIPIHP